MIRKLLLALSVLGISGVAMAQPAGFIDQVTVGIRTSATATSATRFYLWYPAAANPIKGILAVSARGAGYNNGNGFQFGINPIIRECATRNSLAIIVHQDNGDAGIVTNFDPALDHGDSLLHAYDLLAQRNSKPELSNAPLIPFGHSLGAIYSSNMAYWDANRVAATINYKAVNMQVPSWTSPLNPTKDVSSVPYLMVSGELEGPDINNNSGGFYAQSVLNGVLNFRSSGNLIYQGIEYNGTHSTLTPRVARFMAQFIDKVMQYRIPANADPRLGPVTLNTILQSGGYLGKVQTWNNFSPASYTILPYDPGQSASSQWFFDQETAENWLNFHTEEMSYNITGGSQPFNCTSSLTLNYQVTSPDTVMGANNLYWVELSNLRGDFNSGSFPPRVIGSVRSAAKSGSIALTIPDNLQYEISRAANTPKRYRIRLLSSNPPMESSNQGETDIDTCATQGLWVVREGFFPSTPLCPDSTPTFNIRVFKRASLVADPGATLTAEMSDSTGSFANAVIIGQEPANFISNRDTVEATFPTGQLPGVGYRVRVTLSSPQVTSTTNGSNIIIGCPLPVSSQPQIDDRLALQLWPNPVTGGTLHVHSRLAQTVQVAGVDGRVVYRTCLQVGDNVIDVRHLPPGIYLLQGERSNSRFVK